MVTATLYQWLRELPRSSIDLDALVRDHPTREQILERIQAEHGRHADEVSGEFMKKYRSREELRIELARVADGWPGLWKRLADGLRPAEAIRSTLAQAGAPTKVQALGLTPAHLGRSLRLAHQIRGRYTVLDFATGLGVLPDRADEVLAASGCI